MFAFLMLRISKTIKFLIFFYLFFNVFSSISQTNEDVPLNNIVQYESPKPISSLIFEDFLGNEVNLNNYHGKLIIINFWAAMCPPCRAEMPELQNFYNLYQGKVTIVGIDVGKQTGLGTTEEAIKLMETLNIDYPTGSLNDPDSLKTFNVSTMPTTIFMDSNGDIFRRWTGAITFETLSVITNLMLSYQDT